MARSRGTAQLAIAIIAIFLAWPSAGAFADTIPYPVDSGIHSNSGTETEIVFTERVVIDNAVTLRLRFGDYNLGQRSFLRITSESDGADQHLDAVSMANYRSSSAFFNGGAVDVELHAAPGDDGVFIQLESVTFSAADGSYRRSQCGDTDDRVPSTDQRVARILNRSLEPDVFAATAFLIANGAFVTAGHNVTCQTPVGPMCQLFLDALIEFNVPNSQIDGSPVSPDPADQYSIDPLSINYRFPGFATDKALVGQDWAVFLCLPNSETGLLPGAAQRSHVRVVIDTPAVGTDVAVTGYGIDSGVRNFIHQVGTGPFHSENSATAFQSSLRYQVDTRGGNSGSPVFWPEVSAAIGVHTEKGCEDEWNTNFGTSFRVQDLAIAMENALGSPTIYVDMGSNPSSPDGQIFAPLLTVGAGVAAAPSGARINIVAGTYNESITINKQVTLTAPVGTVVIGR